MTSHLQTEATKKKGLGGLYRLRQFRMPLPIRRVVNVDVSIAASTVQNVFYTPPPKNEVETGRVILS